MNISIKSVSAYSPKFGSLPCGCCHECREVKRSSWTFRLRVELEALVKKGWQVGFCTLTYNDEHLPRIPLYFCKDTNVSITPMCFSRDDVSQFLKGMRNWCYRKYGMKNDKDNNVDSRFRFIVCSEYGEHTQRSHYHALFAFPPYCDPRKFYEQIKRQWCERGYIFPRYFEGGRDSSGYEHKPFIVDTVSAACAYCSKYCCKDLSYFSSIDVSKYFKSVVDWDGEKDLFSRYMPFHAQSRSLGLSWLNTLDDSKKVDVLMNGFSFVGDDRLRNLPVYLKDKILYNVYYVKDSSGKRLSRKQANDFLRSNYVEIFNKKCEKLEEVVSNWSKFRHLGECEAFRSYYSEFCYYDSLFRSYRHRVCRDFVAYGGVSYSLCVDVNRARFWLNRYLSYDSGGCVNECEIGYFDDDGYFKCDLPCVSYEYLVRLNRYFYLGNLLDTVFKRQSDSSALQLERRKQQMRELYLHGD